MCGEHGVKRLSLEVHRGSSPHVRGARIPGKRPAGRGGIIPACAGSTLRILTRPPPIRDHPRMCGEHDGVQAILTTDKGSSPHVRGALNTWRWNNPLSGIIPACAGSTSSTRLKARPRRDHPRMCGEHLPLSLITIATWGSSPHVRGAHMFGIGGQGGKGIIPACAGSTVWFCHAKLPSRDHPRMCGEHP